MSLWERGWFRTTKLWSRPRTPAQVQASPPPVEVYDQTRFFPMNIFSSSEVSSPSILVYSLSNNPMEATNALARTAKDRVFFHLLSANPLHRPQGHRRQRLLRSGQLTSHSKQSDVVKNVHLQPSEPRRRTVFSRRESTCSAANASAPRRGILALGRRHLYPPIRR